MPRFPSLPGRPKRASKDTWATKRPMLPVEELPVRPEELCVGSMVWLRQRFPNEEDITCVRDGHCTNFTLNGAGYMHPVVILKIWQRPGSEQPGDLMLAVSELTGFRNNTTLASYNEKRVELIKFFEAIPILHYGESKYGETEQLVLESGWMRKKSWIRLQHVLLVPVSYFWKYDWHEGGHAYDQRLNKESYERLMVLFSMERDEYESTASVVKNATSRLARLASQEGWKSGKNEGQQLGGQQFGNQQFGMDERSASPLGQNAFFQGNYHFEQNPTMQGHVGSYEYSNIQSSNFNPGSSTHSQPPRTYVGSHMYQPSVSINTPSLHFHPGINPTWTSNNASRPVSQYRPPPNPQPVRFYPAASSPIFQPAVQNNFYFHESPAYFNGPMNRNFGVMPCQNILPDYPNPRQQWQQGMVQQQQPLSQYFGQQAQQSNEQHMFQQTRHSMPQPPVRYSQIADWYKPSYPQRINPFLQPFLDQTMRNRSMPTQPQNQIGGLPLQPPHGPFQTSYLRSSAFSDAPSMRIPPSTANVDHTNNRSMVSNGNASPARQRVSPHRVSPYHSPQVEDYKEVEAGAIRD
ncbi:hypothetical protein N431DRAFT_329857 [Stipitochalara longipes BDJ]|nr:hypothetical protein N431DRAFT_329857 [Stipitochalara longipes BDJ]